MKNSILSLILLVVSLFSALAEAERVPVNFGKNGNSNSNKEWSRAPVHINVIVEYDDDTHTIIVLGEDGIDAEVYLYDSNGIIMDYSPVVNTIFYITMSGDYTISFVSENWSGEGSVSVEI